MRTFKCYTCEHTWEIPHGEGGRGRNLVCPKCGSENVHRENKPRGYGGRRWYERSSISSKSQQE